MLSDAHFHGATSFQKAKICKMLYRPWFMSNQQVFSEKKVDFIVIENFT